MTRPLIRCDGCNVGALAVPPFTVSAGEAVCLHIPSPWGFEDAAKLLAVLTGQVSVPGFEVLGRVAWAEPARGRVSLARLLLGEERPADWLRRHARISREKAREVAADWLGRDAEYPLSHLAWNPRQRLGVAAALESGADVVLFSPAGCDPVGAKMLVEKLLERLGQRGAVLLSYPRVQGDEVAWDRPDGLPSVEITQRPGTATDLIPSPGPS